MDFLSIKHRSLAVLEQACERYAIMAFETLNGCLAIDLQSIQYSYRNDSRQPNRGVFKATFKPWKQLGKSPRQEQNVYVGWNIEALPDGKWRLSEGIATEKDRSYSNHLLQWSEDGLSMKFGTLTSSPMYELGEKKEVRYCDKVTI